MPSAVPNNQEVLATPGKERVLNVLDNVPCRAIQQGSSSMFFFRDGETEVELVTPKLKT